MSEWARAIGLTGGDRVLLDAHDPVLGHLLLIAHWDDSQTLWVGNRAVKFLGGEVLEKTTDLALRRFDDCAACLASGVGPAVEEEA